MEPKYIAECGCVLGKDERKLKIKTINGKKRKKYVCPEHGDDVLAYYIVCAVCGEIRVSTTHRIPIYCKDCANKVKKLRSVLGASKKKAVTEEQLLMALLKPFSEQFDNYYNPERWDCEHRHKCIDDFIKFDTIPCLGCQYYNPIDFRIQEAQWLKK